ncbi:cell death regulator Aven isoform X2 [Hoplias malabaricus]|uniref:cell death regulator Aven isoform X2 n=1 Tax=Hoplias malabaricus TaxID=27720 RepID=UPI003462FC3C
MEGRGGRGRGGEWRRGGGAAHHSAASGERRGRGRGGHHRGRGKRDFHRGRGRGGADNSTDFYNRGQDEQDDKENVEEEMPSIYSRRKLESNWDRYEEPEKDKDNDGVPVQRGTDYNVLLSSAGDSYTQFRFSEEKDWEVDSLAVNKVSAVFVDLEALAKSLQELPLHTRLNLEADLIQVTTPVELPSLSMPHKVDANVTAGVKLLAPQLKSREAALGGSSPVKTLPGTSISSQASTSLTDSKNDADEELDLLLGLQKPVTEVSTEECMTSDKAGVCASKGTAPVVEETENKVVDAEHAKAEEVERNQQMEEELKPQKSSVKQELTEEDLEDWLDSMIS